LIIGAPLLITIGADAVNERGTCADVEELGDDDNGDDEARNDPAPNMKFGDFDDEETERGDDDPEAGPEDSERGDIEVDAANRGDNEVDDDVREDVGDDDELEVERGVQIIRSDSVLQFGDIYSEH